MSLVYVRASVPYTVSCCVTTSNRIEKVSVPSLHGFKLLLPHLMQYICHARRAHSAQYPSSALKLQFIPYAFISITLTNETTIGQSMF